MTKEMMYDPPSGWKYGFPKRYDPAHGEPMSLTLIRDGYPVKDADFAAKHCRFYESEVDDTAARLAVEGWPFGREGSNGDHIAVNDNVRHVAKATGRIQDDPLYQEFERKANEQGFDHAFGGKPWSTRRGDWMQLYSGKQFWPMDPLSDDIEIEDIAHSLAMQCRYAGHCVRFYSVAEHSVLLARHFLDAGHVENALWALLHDASEAYLVDVPRPVKPFLSGYREAEARVMDAVCERFGLHPGMPPEVHAADSAIIGDERANMKPCVVEWAGDFRGLGIELFYWPPERAESAFLSCYREIQRVRQRQRRVG